MHDELELILERKYNRIIKLLSEELNISLTAAKELFYKSTAYQMMVERENPFYTMSDGYIVDEVKIEFGYLEDKWGLYH